MTDIDTAALRRWAEANDSIGTGLVAISTNTVRALCDAYEDESVTRAFNADLLDQCHRFREQTDAARLALAALVADLRALLAYSDDPDGLSRAYVYQDELDAVIDRHAPEGDA